METFNGLIFQATKDISSGKRQEYLKAGLKNADLKCMTEIFIAGKPVPTGSRIMIAHFNLGIVPAFCVIETTVELAGRIGTRSQENLYGGFSCRAYSPVLIMSEEPTEPLKSSEDLFIQCLSDFPAGGKIKLKILYTQ